MLYKTVEPKITVQIIVPTVRYLDVLREPDASMHSLNNPFDFSFIINF